MENRLDGKVIIITGGTSGIGATCAETFVKAGAYVILCGRRIEKGIELTRYLNDIAQNLHNDDVKNVKPFSTFYNCDVSDEKEVSSLIDKVVSIYGNIDILFNNAGIMLPSKEIEKISADEWDSTFRCNLHGIFYTCKYAKPYLIKSKGVILNNASIAGMQSYSVGRSYAYSASKAGVIQFTHQMAKNYAEYGIRVNCICPGIIDTEILGNRDRNEYVKRIPLGRIGVPDDVASVALFLVSDAASYLTGVVLPVDGGISL